MPGSIPCSHPSIAVLAGLILLVSASAVPAQPPSHAAGPEPSMAEEDLTLVVGTRFVSSTAEKASPRAQFTDARISLALFNKTDHCVDQQALQLAMQYFNSLGPLLGRAGHFYVVPHADIANTLSMCERLHELRPQAFVGSDVQVIAFGKIVPTADAPALEKSIR